MVSIEKLKHADQLESVAYDVFDHPIRPEYLSAFLNAPSHVMFLAVENGVVVGMASGFEYFHPDKPSQLFINEVGVAPPYRRKGVGRQLTQALIEEAKSKKCTYAWLGTDVTNVSGNACFSSVPNVEPASVFNLYEWDLGDD